jgi:hypothetical protein
MHENGCGIHNLCVVGVGGRGGAVGNYCNCEQLGLREPIFLWPASLSGLCGLRADRGPATAVGVARPARPVARVSGVATLK